MTDEDWRKFDEQVAELKRTGEYMKPDYVDVSYPEDAFKAFELPPENPDKPYLSNFGVLIPMGEDGCKIIDENGEKIIPKWDWPNQ